MRAHVPGKVDFYVTYPESSRWDDGAYRQSLAETLRRQYAGIKLDLVITVSDPALEFTLQYRDKMFPGTPIVVTGIGSEWLVGRKFHGVTGVASQIGVPETIDLALHLHPDADSVAVIGSDSSIDWAVAHSELLRHQGKVQEVDIIGPPNSQMLETVTALPPHTVVLFQVFASESTQPAVGVYDILDAVASRFPIYSAWRHLALGHGGVGGAYQDYSREEELTGEISARVLSGERADDIPIVFNSGLQVEVDWRALQRWRIPESALPPGVVVLYREPTFWACNRKYIVAAAVVIVAQLLWIAALLWQRARKRKAEAVLRESEKRFQAMADTTPSLIWMADQNGKITYLNSKSVEFTGDPQAGFGDSWSEYVHPDDLDGVLSANARALAKRVSFSKEYRLRRYDGVYRWMLDVASPRVNGDGSFAGYIGSAIDITDQKVAQDALENVSGRLIEAQEKERSRIARDLHDDICQRLALLSMELEQANRTLNAAPEVTNKRLEEIQRRCAEITTDVQVLSHQLHSSKLEYLGIAAAVRSLCRDLAGQHGANIEFNEEGLPKHLPKDVSLCLFRVAQEGLHNAVKYSGTNQYTVRLRCIANKVELEVADSGTGFDLEAAKRNGGLGLISMQERVHLVHGKFFAKSAPGAGTRIIATVPLSSENTEIPADAGGKEARRITGAA